MGVPVHVRWNRPAPESDTAHAADLRARYLNGPAGMARGLLVPFQSAAGPRGLLVTGPEVAALGNAGAGDQLLSVRALQGGVAICLVARPDPDHQGGGGGDLRQHDPAVHRLPPGAYPPITRPALPTAVADVARRPPSGLPLVQRPPSGDEQRHPGIDRRGGSSRRNACARPAAQEFAKLPAGRLRRRQDPTARAGGARHPDHRQL